MSRPLNGGALRSTTFTTSSKFGSHALSGGATDVTGVDAAIVSTTTGTLEAWVKVPASGSVKVFAAGAGYWLGYQNDKFVASWPGVGGGIFTTTFVITDNAWHHIAIVFTPSATTLFADGNRVANQAATSLSTDVAAIGGLYAAGFDTDGPVDEVRWSSTARYSGTTYTTPTAAFANDSDTLGLYHLDNNVNDDNSAGPTDPPANTVAPAVTGTTTTGQTLTCSTGTWTNSPTSYTYQWKRNGSNISGATSSTYVLQVADEGTSVKCTVTATNGIGSASADSNTVSPTSGGSAPANTVAPALSGTTVTGQTLSCSTGTWTNTPTSYAYQWKRAGSNISGATSATYVLQVADEGVSVKCTVTATNGTGSASADSNTVTPTAAGAAFTPTDPNILYSPYNWDVTAARAKTMNSGAYLRALITGSPTGITATFDTSSVTSTPKLSYRVDDGPWTDVDLASSVALTLPTTNVWGKHLVEIVVKATDYAVSRWTSDASAVKFTGFSVTGGTSPASQSIARRGLNILAYGDSISEGMYTLKNSGNGYLAGSARQSYAYMLADLLGAEVGLVAFGGQGVSTGYVSVPAWSSAYDKLFASGTTPTRSFSTVVPDVILINQGENDGAVSSGAWRTAATTVVNALLAATPATTMLVMLRPLSGAHATDVQFVAENCNAPGRVKYVDTTGWFSTADGEGGVHPWGYANSISMGPRTAAAIRLALRRGATYIKKGDGTAKLVSTVRT